MNEISPDYEKLNRDLDAKFEVDIASISASIDRLKKANAVEMRLLMVVEAALKIARRS